jgi:hypothetical protein
MSGFSYGDKVCFKNSVPKDDLVYNIAGWSISGMYSGIVCIENSGKIRRVSEDLLRECTKLEVHINQRIKEC